MSRQTELGKLLSELERVLSKQKKVYSPDELGRVLSELGRVLSPMVARQLARFGEQKWGRDLGGPGYSIYYEEIGSTVQWYVRSNSQRVYLGESEPRCDCYIVRLDLGARFTFQCGDRRADDIWTEGLSERKLQGKLDLLLEYPPSTEGLSERDLQEKLDLLLKYPPWRELVSTFTFPYVYQIHAKPPERIVCPQCGSEVMLDDKFCAACGAKLQ